MSDSDISAKGVLIKYKERGQYFYLHKGPKGDIVGVPKQKDALLFTPVQAKNTINMLKRNGFPHACGPEVVR